MGPRRGQHRPLWHLPQPVDARLRLPQDVRRHPQWQPEYGSPPPSWGDPLVWLSCSMAAPTKPNDMCCQVCAEHNWETTKVVEF